jgi:PAS domain S-box-containing protein
MADTLLRDRVADLERLVTRHEKIEESLRQSETYYRTILEYACNGVTVVDENGIVRYQSPSKERILGYSSTETVGKPVFDLLDPDDLDNAMTVFARLKDSPGVPLVSVNRFKHKDGSTRLLESRVINLLDDPHVQGIIASFRDVTERKDTEAALLESEERYRALFESSPVPVVVHSLGKIVHVNPEAVRTMDGRSPADFVGKSIMDFVHADYREADEERVRRLYAKEGPVAPQEQKFVRADGTVIDVLVISSPVDYRGVPASQVVFQDITKRKRAETALKLSEERLRLALQAARMGTWEWNVQTGEILVSETTEKIYGIEPKSTGWTIEEHAGYLHPEDRGAVTELIAEILRGGEESPAQTEYRIVRPDGETRWVEACGEIARDGHGVPQRVLGTVVDITERKRAESEKRFLETQLRQAQKMETIGTLAGGIAHDFNNILGPILGYSDMLLADGKINGEVKEDLGYILKAAYRAKELVQQILLFSRQSERDRTPVQIHLIVKEALKLIKATMPSTIDIQQDIDGDCDAVMADPTQIHQVFLNLCTNARHAMRETGGTLKVSLKHLEADEAFLRMHTGLTEGRYLRLTVSDTGHGINGPHLERIFEPFFTTKEMGEGTGLGLSVAHGIVVGHGGAITVDSQPGRGTSFHVYLPCVVASPAPVLSKDVPRAPANESVLYVEDQEEVAAIGRKMLERLGYNATVVSNGADALDIFREDVGRFDLVLTDQMMPGMTGADLASKLLRIRPRLPIVLMTGFSETATPDSAKRAGIRCFIRKPIVTRELAIALREALETETAAVD